MPVTLCTLILAAMVAPSLVIVAPGTAPGIVAASGAVAPVITSVSFENATVLRNGDGLDSDAKTVARITVQAQDNDGITEIDAASGACFITIYDPDNTVVADNVDISSSYSQVDDNTAQWYYDFDPADGAALGKYRYAVYVNDEYSMSAQVQPRQRPVTISTTENSTCPGYQIKVTVPYDSEMRSDYSDIRFFQDNGDPLYYWIENYTGAAEGTDNAYVWVKYPDNIPASSNVTIYLVYGASWLASMENGDNVFELFDDFSGSCLDTGKWSSSGTVNLEDGVARISGTRAQIRSLTAFGVENAVKFRASIENTINGIGFSTDPSGGNYKYHDFFGPTYNQTIESDGDTYTQLGNSLTETTIVYQITRSGLATRFYANDDNDRNNDNLVRDAVKISTMDRYAAAGTWNDRFWEIDWMFVRKVIEGEPTASVGAEENYSEISVTATSRIVENWSGAINATAVWQEVESWRATIKAPAWLDIDIWAGMINSNVVWTPVESWNETICSVGTSLKIVETWSGAVTNSPTWQAVEDWTGTISTPSEPVQQQSSPPPATQGDTTSPKIETLEPTTENVGQTVTARVRVTDPSGIDNGSIVVTLDNENSDYVLSEGVITISFVDLALGEHRLYIYVRDASSNRNATSTEILLRVSSEPLTENQVISLENGENAVVAFENTDVYEIVIEIENNGGLVENLQVSVSTVQNAGENQPENIAVYSYLEISVPGFQDVVSSAEIKFKVEKEWIAENGLSPLAVVLCRLDEDSWVELPTEIMGEDGDFYFFSARTSSFSVFAIGGRSIFPTLELVIPQGAIEIENGYATISLWVRNPTSATLSKNLELKFESVVTPFEINVEPDENELITIYVLIENTHGETCDVELCDADTQTVLDKGEVTLLSSSELPIDMASPAPQLLVFAILSIVAGVGSMKIYGKIGRNGRVNTHHERRKVTKLKEVNEDSFKTSPIVHEYYELLLPVARTTSVKSRTKKRKNS